MKKYIWLIFIVLCFSAFSFGALYGRSTSGETLILNTNYKYVKTDSETIEKTEKTDNLININEASAEMLKTLKGIGDITAQRIIEYRTYNGHFEKIEDIKNVTGIGEKLFEDIKDDIIV